MLHFKGILMVEIKKIVILFFYCSIVSVIESQFLQQLENDIINIIANIQHNVVKLELFYPHTNTRISSGIILDNQGHIVTLATAVEKTNKIKVHLQSDKTTEADIIGTDTWTNVAVLKMKEHIEPIPKGDSDKLQIGSILIVIGNPYGLNKSVSLGIVSGLHRCVWLRGSLTPLIGLIQTTAPINPGDDGGLVVNSQGEFIGMSFSTIQRELFVGTQKKLFFKMYKLLKSYQEQTDFDPQLALQFDTLIQEMQPGINSSNIVSQGINFILPSNRIYWVSESIIRYGTVNRGWLGITVVNMEQPGVLVSKVNLDSPAYNILQEGDQIITLNDTLIMNSAHIYEIISYCYADVPITITYQRNNQLHKVTLRLALHPSRN